MRGCSMKVHLVPGACVWITGKDEKGDLFEGEVGGCEGR